MQKALTLRALGEWDGIRMPNSETRFVPFAGARYAARRPVRPGHNCNIGCDTVSRFWGPPGPTPDCHGATRSGRPNGTSLA